MPRKNNPHNQKYVKPDYHSQNKKAQQDQLDDPSVKKKIKLRTSLDIYNRLMHDKTLNIDLNTVNIGYSDKVLGDQEMCILNWVMIDKGGDIPMHHILYFVLNINDQTKIKIWDRQQRLDRLYCSGLTDKETQSLNAVLEPLNLSNNQNGVEIESKQDVDEEKKQTVEITRNENDTKVHTFTIISGGQTGADQGGLEAAKSLNIKTAGWAPVDFMTNKGPDPSLANMYGLKAIKRTTEMSAKSKGYAKRDKMNVNLCDVFIGFIVDEPKTGMGTLKTANYAKTKKYKYIDVDRKVKYHVFDDRDRYWKPVLILVDLSE